MTTSVTACFLCAWREKCQKRFSIGTDFALNVNCPDFTRDVTIRESELDDHKVKFHLEKWRQAASKPSPYIITISRETGAGGSEVARRLADELKMDLIGGQIIERVAKNARMSTKVVETLDEKAVSRVDSMINSLFVSRHLSPDSYLRHLTWVLGTIGEHGNAIVVGRGANFVLPKEITFRIRFVAPKEYRVQHFMKSRGMTKEEATKYVDKRDADRMGYVRNYFKADASDPSHYDLVINTEMTGIEGAAKIAVNAFHDWVKKSEQAAPTRKSARAK
ncbi:MAG TPA: cytidylate kinase-like family protein [Syntrophales bacterium]|nr:cytidylate kinase-like family protein [Syntrophales bacterium]